MSAFVRRISTAAFAAAFAACSLAAPSREVDIHDPAITRQGDTYYLYSTGPGIPFYSSKDRVHWTARGSVLATPPAWVKSVNGAFNGHEWAPDVTYHDGRYFLYYAASSPAVADSAIALAVSKSLDPSSPDYKWEDKGVVLRSIAGRDLWNAIDPNVIVDEKGTPWMVFGSFWTGIKLVKLNEAWTGLAEPQEWHALAKRERSVFVDDREPEPGQIEGPFLFKKGDYYYLFVSTGMCCRGKNSTYRMAVGRARSVTGPYLDKDGRDMAKGGGTLLMTENKAWAGWGGQSVYSFDGEDYVVFHAYEAADNDFHRLKISAIRWDASGWPTIDSASLDSFHGYLTK